MDLEVLREEIRKRDLEIIRLIAERTALAQDVARTKMETHEPLRNLQVEKKVIARYVDEGRSKGLSEDTMRSVASALIEEAVESESRLMKRNVGKRVAIIGGAGKMGAWMSELMTENGSSVIIVDPAIDNGKTIDDCSDCDVVIVSVPIHLTGPILKKLDRICKDDALIFDLTSLKTPIVDILKELASKRKVCSIHPMFGPSARSMFDRNLIVCDCGNKNAVDDVVSMFDDMGGNIRVMDISEHDGYMSYVLGLTHAVNIALFTVLDNSGYTFDDLRSVASTTFNKGLDTNVSVASEDPALYYEIQHMNSHRDEMWDLFTKAVDDLREASLSDDPERFISIMDAGREYFADGDKGNIQRLNEQKRGI